MLGNPMTGIPEHDERYNRLWEGFRAIALAATAQAAQRQTGAISEVD